jgi:ATP-dependent Clp protease ATP-binding subunit ClpA
LEDYLHRRVINQEEAIKAVANTLRRARAGISSSKRPVGVFLFLGPTGVGKTETAKALAENYFGDEKNMIRLDMSEYQEISAIDKLIGSNTNPSGVLTDAILANPFSLILLDEIEKANKNVLNLFLQVFEDGRLTDPRGRISDFTNAIIIATSNAGSEFIRQNVTKLSNDRIEEQLINLLQEKGIFSPEFLNRFDGVIVFKPLTQEQLIQVANLMIADINKRLKDKNITVEVVPDALAKLVELGYDPQFGARPMRRVIQEKVENLLAKKMLEGKVGGSQKILVTLDEINNL